MCQWDVLGHGNGPGVTEVSDLPQGLSQRRRQAWPLVLRYPTPGWSQFEGRKCAGQKTQGGTE